jgi:protein phosphatase 1L
MLKHFFAAIPLSDDHKPNRSDEQERIENAGGFVKFSGMSN